MELENLALFPESEAGYIELLKRNGFTVLSIRDDSSAYLRFNHEIVERLQDSARREAFLALFESGIEASIEGYESIAQALEVGELKVIRFVAQKN